jgi:hypothetical protein
MHARLRPFAKEALFEPLKVLCQTKRIPLPGRICRRNRNALVCFFCKYFPDFPVGFPPLQNLVKARKTPRARPAEDHDDPVPLVAVEPAGLAPMAESSEDRPRRPTTYNWEWGAGSDAFSFAFLDELFPDD